MRDRPKFQIRQPPTILFGQENRNSNFNNFLHGDINNPDKLLNLTRLLTKQKRKSEFVVGSVKRDFITYTIMIYNIFSISMT